MFFAFSFDRSLPAPCSWQKVPKPFFNTSDASFICSCAVTRDFPLNNFTLMIRHCNSSLTSWAKQTFFSKFQICCVWRELWGMGTRSWIAQSSNQLRDLFLKEGMRSFPWNVELTQKLYLLTKLKNWFFVIYWESHVCNRKNNVSLAIIISSSNVAIRRLPPNYRIVECSAALASKV